MVQDSLMHVDYFVRNLNLDENETTKNLYIVKIERFHLVLTLSLKRGWVIIYMAISPKKSRKKRKIKKKYQKAGKNTWAETGKCHFQVTENRENGKSANPG